MTDAEKLEAVARVFAIKQNIEAEEKRLEVEEPNVPAFGDDYYELFDLAHSLACEVLNLTDELAREKMRFEAYLALG